MNPYPPGSHVIYEGQLAYYRGDTVVVLGPCDCRRCPCQEPDCLPHAQPHYELGDERGDVVMAHARHSNLRPAPHCHTPPLPSQHGLNQEEMTMTYPQLLTPEEKLTAGKHSLGLPPIVVICGSTRFMADMTEADLEMTASGYIVVKPGCDMKQPHPLWADPTIAERIKTALDDLHRAKIRLADEVLVVGDYIGDSTRAEIAYARELGKPVRFTHPEVDPDPEPMPCGESGCICYGVGEEHADCACGCDCPRCDLCRHPPEDCDCDD